MRYFQDNSTNQGGIAHQLSVDALSVVNSESVANFGTIKRDINRIPLVIARPNPSSGRTEYIKVNDYQNLDAALNAPLNNDAGGLTIAPLTPNQIIAVKGLSCQTSAAKLTMDFYALLNRPCSNGNAQSTYLLDLTDSANPKLTIDCGFTMQLDAHVFLPFCRASWTIDLNTVDDVAGNFTAPAVTSNMWFHTNGARGIDITNQNYTAPITPNEPAYNYYRNGSRFPLAQFGTEKPNWISPLLAGIGVVFVAAGVTYLCAASAITIAALLNPIVLAPIIVGLALEVVAIIHMVIQDNLPMKNIAIRDKASVFTAVPTPGN